MDNVDNTNSLDIIDSIYTLKCFFIRHGKTNGNLEKRYIGRKTDESLSEEGAAELKKLASKYAYYIYYGINEPSQIEDSFPKIDMDITDSSVRLYSGAMKRCRETMELLFPLKEFETLNNLTEIDFGDFEGKNYKELSDNSDYQKWIDSNGTIAFPNGESREEFISRTVNAFICSIRDDLKKADIQNKDTLVFVCHGGNIMAFLSYLTGRDYFDFMSDPGDGYEVLINVTEEKIDVISYNRIFDRLDI